MKRKIAVQTLKVEETKKDERNILLETLNDYCSTSTLHGISYLGAKDKSLPEKIWWLIMFILSVVTCAYLISSTWKKWQNNPVILSFENEQISISQIPFPAVTICPLNKVMQHQYNYTEMFRHRNNLINKEYRKFWGISLVCNLQKYCEEFSSSINLTDESAVAFIREVAPKLNDTFGFITWKHKIQDKNIFAEQLTCEGVCFTFNSFSQEDMFTSQLNHDIIYINHKIKNSGWNIEKGYDPNANTKTYPRNSVKNGQLSGFSVNLYSYMNQTDYVCGPGVSGYKVFLHNPAETPKESQYYLIPLNRKVTITMQPELTTTSKDIQSLSAQSRKCYFSYEKFLRFFKLYTQNNCRVECDANITLQYCGCVPFHMPRDKNTSICGFGKVDCLREVESAIIDLEELSGSEITKGNQEKLANTREIFTKCDCQPSCTSLQYNAEISQTGLHTMKGFLDSGLIDSRISPLERTSMETGMLTSSQVDIFFKESQFWALRRSELYGRTDFFANCGGLLGLFMGFSLLSLLEIVYFLTIRLWVKYRHRQQIKLFK